MSFLMVFGAQSMAQTRGSMFLSASFPIKDYAEFDGFDDFALTSPDGDDGGAGIGFNLGLKWYFNVGVEGLGVMLSMDGFFNGPNPDLKVAYRNKEGYIDGRYITGLEYNSTPKYINAPLMLGLNYIYHFNPNFGIYAEAGAGGNARFITSMESVHEYNDLDLGAEIRQTTTQRYDNAFTFAWQAGAGIEVARNLVVGFSFYDLGKADVKGEETIRKRNLNENVSITDPSSYNTLGHVHQVMLLGRIGFTF